LGHKRVIIGLGHRKLTDEEVEELHNTLVRHILEKTGGELRK
jgi:phenylalanyl-tRNA synthetase beta subunit